MPPHRLPLITTFVLAFACAVASHAALARGAESTLIELSQIRLQYDAPRVCPSAARVQREIQRLLAGSRVSSPIQSAIDVVQRRGRFEVSLTLQSPVSGERTISHAKCALAVRAAALIVAIAIDPDVATREQARGADGEDAFAEDAQPGAANTATPAAGEPATKPASDAAPDRNSNSTSSPTSNSAPKDDARESWPTELPESAGQRFKHRYLAELGFVLERGLAPEVSPGVFAGVGLQGRHWRAAVVPAVLPRSEALNDSGTGARFVHVWVDLQLCVRSGGEAINAGLCALMRQTWAFASGIGADENLSGQGSWQTFGAGPLLAVRLNSWLQLQAQLLLELPLQRPRFVIDNLDAVVFQPESLGGAATLGVVTSF